MRHMIVAGLLLILTSCSPAETVDARVSSNDRSKDLTSTLFKKKWIHGATDCNSNADPAIEIFRYDQSSYILRQNKCIVWLYQSDIRFSFELRITRVMITVTMRMYN